MHVQIKVMYRLSVLFKDKLMVQIFRSTTTFPVNPDEEGLSVDKEAFLFSPADKEVSKFSACQEILKRKSVLCFYVEFR